MYKFAAQHRLRFESVRGLLMVEQLFAMPLKAADGFDLDTVARSINTRLKGVGEESFVADASSDPFKKELQAAMDIVLDVIKTKQDESKARLAAADKATKRRKLLDLLAEKRDAALGALTTEEIEKELAALDG